MLNIFLRLPPFAYFILTAVLIYLGTLATDFEKTRQEQRALALQSPAPAIVNLADAPAYDTHPADEVHVAAQINHDYNYRLFKGDERDSQAHAMWVLFDPAADTDAKTVKAAILIPLRDKEKFIDWLFEQIDGAGQVGPVFNINGVGERSSGTYAKLAKEAMDDEGLQRTSDFFFITPHVDGREVAFAPSSSDGTSVQQTANLIALLLAAFGGLKIWYRNRVTTRRSRASLAQMEHNTALAERIGAGQRF